MTDLWVKICGMTTPEAVDAAMAARADAIGFVFAPSVRQLTPTQAAQLATPARGRLALVAVMRHPSQESLDGMLATFRPDILQTDAADLQLLRFPTQLTLLPVLRARQTADCLPPRVLFEGLTSGSGKICDWSGAREIAPRTELILAGGLNIANVASAIAQVRPFGVDVSSGVEARPGIKSPEAIAQFVLAARAPAEVLA